MSASGNNVSFDFFTVHETCSSIQRNHISVASNFFCTCFETVQVSHPYINGFNIALQGSSSCLNRDVVIG